MDQEELFSKGRVENKNRGVYEQEVLKQVGFSADKKAFGVKYIKPHRKHELMMAIAYTILVSAMPGYHIDGLIVPSTILQGGGRRGR